MRSAYHTDHNLLQTNVKPYSPNKSPTKLDIYKSIAKTADTGISCLSSVLMVLLFGTTSTIIVMLAIVATTRPYPIKLGIYANTSEAVVVVDTILQNLVVVVRGTIEFHMIFRSAAAMATAIVQKRIRSIIILGFVRKLRMRT